MPSLGIQLGTNGYGPFGWWPEEDLPRVLAIARDAGYAGAEIMTDQLGADTVDEVRGAFADAGLCLIAVHAFVEELDSAVKLEDILRRMAKVDCQRLIVSAGGNRTAADFRSLTATVQHIATRAAVHGTRTYFHPHHGEFRPLEDDDSRRGVDVLADGTDADLVLFNIDVYWAQRGGTDPVDAVRQFGPRGGYYHVRDSGDQHSALLGSGDIDVAGCLAAAADAGCEWLVYEDPTPKLPPTALCQNAARYMRANYPGPVAAQVAMEEVR